MCFKCHKMGMKLNTCIIHPSPSLKPAAKISTSLRNNLNLKAVAIIYFHSETLAYRI